MPAPVRRSRLVLLLLTGLLVAAACGTDAEEQLAVTSTTTTAPQASTPGQPAPADEQPASDVEGTPQGTAPPAASAPDASGAPAPGETTPGGDAEPVPAAGPVGSLAGWYLRPAGAEQILVQVLAQDGAGPRTQAPERVRQVLAQLSGKPVAVSVGAVGGGARSWTADELRAIADGSSPAQTAEQGVLTVLFLHGGFAENDRAVGVAVRGDVAAVFAERVDEASGMLGNPGAVEDAVTMHEVGHLLGLVDLVLDTGRQDPEHPGHSPNRGSVMYYAVESTVLGSVLSGGPPRDFDQADLDDLARIRNG
ncbi:MAG TPA: hypothetical protein VLR27_02155 [Acidimicrobiales bacterium]|nr:hypothetical protein [Acidimicrobiales bacterium]